MVQWMHGTALAVGLTAVGLSGGAEAADRKPLTVIEMFTSQGCSACPPADAMLSELSKRDGVLALSFHVDYWDYVGWPDTLADPAHTRRQRAYATNFGRRYVYTPQVVVNGGAEGVGSNRESVMALVEKASPRDSLAVDLAWNDDKALEVRLPAAPAVPGGAEADVWMVVFDHRQTVSVSRGENAGRTLEYVNAVRALHHLGTWSGEARVYPAEIPGLDSDVGDACAAIVQSRADGRIIGAVSMPLDRSP